MPGMRPKRSLGLAPSCSRAPCSRAANRLRVPATGHSSIQVTVDLYGHFEPGGDRHHVEDLAQAIEAERSAAEARVLAEPEGDAAPDGTLRAPRRRRADQEVVGK